MSHEMRRSRRLQGRVPINRCPVCQSSFIRPVAPRWWERLLARWLKGTPAQCWHCSWHGRMTFVVPDAATGAPAAPAATPPRDESAADPESLPLQR